MQRLVKIAAVTVLLAPTAQADVDCRVVARVGQVLANEYILRTSTNPFTRAEALTRLNDAVLTLDADTVFVSLLPDIPISSRADLDRFFSMTDDIRQHAKSQNFAAVRNRLQQPGVADTMRAVDSMLVSFGCATATMQSVTPPLSDVGAASETIPRQGSRTRPISEEPTQVVTVPRFLLGILATAGATYLMHRSHVRRRRRTKRYPLYHVVRILRNDAESEHVILDISAMGAKLSHDGALSANVGETLKVRLDEAWLDCTVQWSNGPCIGLRFDQRLPMTQVVHILTESKKIRTAEESRENENGTPEGADPIPVG